MNRTYTLSTLTLMICVVLGILGCTAAQLATLQKDHAAAENIYAAATQATFQAKSNLAKTPMNTPGFAAATQAVAASEKGEASARLALDLVKALLDASAKQDPNDPALRDSLVRAISAIPTPWSAVWASLIPAAIPLGASIVQSVRLGRAHQTVAHVSEQLQAHKMALDALQNKSESQLTAPKPTAEKMSGANL